MEMDTEGTDLQEEQLESPFSAWCSRNREWISMVLHGAMFGCFVYVFGQKARFSLTIVMMVAAAFWYVLQGDWWQTHVQGKTTEQEEEHAGAEELNASRSTDGWDDDALDSERESPRQGPELFDIDSEKGQEELPFTYLQDEGEGETPCDAIDKERLDLFMRYMASVESQKKDAGPMTQRQKLQRKLLQRSVASKSTRKEESMAPAVHQACELPEHSDDQLEALLKELGETTGKPTSHKAAARGPMKRAVKRRGNAGAAPSAGIGPAKQPAQSQVDAIELEDADDSERSEAGSVARAERGMGADGGNDAALEEETLQIEGFQVVSKRRSRRSVTQPAESFSALEGRGTPPHPAADSEPEEVEPTESQASDTAAFSPTPVQSSSGPVSRPRQHIVFGSIGQEDSCDEEPPASAAANDVASGSHEVPEAAKGAVEDSNSEEWEWQCPSGYRLEPYICPKPTLCSSCRRLQPAGASVLRSSASSWQACEACIRLAKDLPVESHHEVPAPDPSTMSSLQIAEWFKEHGAEDALQNCMRDVLRARKA